MSGIVIATTTAAAAATGAVLVATLPEATQALTAMFEADHEFAVISASILCSFPILAVLMALAGSARE
jgi:hypothetical protein